VALLYRRAGFGARPAELDAAVAAGYAASVDTLLAAANTPAASAGVEPPPPLAPMLARTPTDAAARARYGAMLGAQIAVLTGWWLRRMAATADPLTEKLTFFWHGHFATSVTKVRSAPMMLAQNQIFRLAGAGAFDALTLAVTHDPAMLIWLDAGDNSRAHPNENFARELMELFTLGIGNYTETDVREAARAFTGWRLNTDRTGFVVVPSRHDDGVKTILGRTGNFSGDDVIGQLTHSATSARWVAARLFSRFAAPVAPTSNPASPAMTAAYGDGLDTRAAVRAMLLSPQFIASRGQLVAQPVEYIVCVLRALGLRVGPTQPATVATAAGATPASPPPGASRVVAGSGELPPNRVIAACSSLGQVPFQPPSVGGWPANAGWLSTASTLARAQFASAAATAADLSAISAEAPAARVDAVAHLLSLDGWTARTRAALTAAQGNPVRLVTLALCSPEYLTV
jgi:uncharacterized protein (DUF1800 family)